MVGAAAWQAAPLLLISDVGPGGARQVPRLDVAGAVAYARAHNLPAPRFLDLLAAILDGVTTALFAQSDDVGGSQDAP